MFSNPSGKFIEEAWKSVKRFFKAVGESISLDIEVGMGLGVEIEVFGIADIEAVAVLSADEFHISSQSELYRKAYASIGVSILGFGILTETYKSVTRDMLKKEGKFWGNSHADNGGDIEPSIGILKKVGNDDILSLGASGYLIFGGGISFSFNVSEFLRILGV